MPDAAGSVMYLVSEIYYDYYRFNIPMVVASNIQNAVKWCASKRPGKLIVFDSDDYDGKYGGGTGDEPEEHLFIQQIKVA